jgi:hypothetical protein
MPEPRPATIEIVAERRGLLALSPWRSVSIYIDGALARMPLGTHAFAVTPGQHEVAVAVGMSTGSKARATVSVDAGASVRLRYRIGLLGAKLEIELPMARVHR